MNPADNNNSNDNNNNNNDNNNNNNSNSNNNNNNLTCNPAMRDSAPALYTCEINICHQCM